MDVKQLNEIEKETKRFLSKLKAARDRLKDEPYMSLGCKETGAVRRAAADLKVELTKITR